MTNKIILELPDKTEVEAENISFIQLHGENNTVRLKVENLEKFKTQKGLLIAVYGSCNTINLGKIFYPVNDTIGLTGLTIILLFAVPDCFYRIVIHLFLSGMIA